MCISNKLPDGVDAVGPSITFGDHCSRTRFLKCPGSILAFFWGQEDIEPGEQPRRQILLKIPKSATEGCWGSGAEGKPLGLQFAWGRIYNIC